MNPKLKVYLGKATAAAWLKHCQGLGRRPGPAIKRLVAEQLRAASPGCPQTECLAVVEKHEREPKVRLALRLTPSESARVRELAEREGCSAQIWVVNVVRATLTKQPQFGMRELEVLGESNYQLLAIGRNLNQIAHRLNAGSVEPVPLGEIKALKAVIDTHTDHASRLIRACVERWSVG